MDTVLDVLTSPTLGNVVRVCILLVGFTLSMACVKFAWMAHRQGESYRGWGLLSYGLFCITPSLSGLFRFGQPVNWLTTITYGLALYAGIMGLRVTYTIDPTWRRIRDEERRTRGGRRRAEDASRIKDRVAQAAERADSRDRYDVNNPATVAQQADRDTERADEDDARDKSQRLQDSDREETRQGEDRRNP